MAILGYAAEVATLDDFLSESEVIAEAAVRGSALVIVPSADLTAANAPAMRQETLALIAQHKPSRIVFDLHRIEFCDSSGVAVFVEAAAKVSRRDDGGVFLTHAADRIQGLIQISRLSTLLKLAPDVPTALGE